MGRCGGGMRLQRLHQPLDLLDAGDKDEGVASLRRRVLGLRGRYGEMWGDVWGDMGSRLAPPQGYSACVLQSAADVQRIQRGLAAATQTSACPAQCCSGDRGLPSSI